MRKLWTRMQLAAARPHWQAMVDGPALVALVALISILVVAVVIFTSPRTAWADSPPTPGVTLSKAIDAKAPSWTGPWVGLHLGGAAVSTGVQSASLAGDGILGGLGAGYDARMGNFVAGVWGEYTWAHLETSLGGESVTLKGAWAGGVRGGVLLTPRLLAYALYGWTHTEASASFTDIPSLDGQVWGGGLEALLPGDALSLKLEYRATNLGNEAVGNGTLDTDHHSIRLGLTWRWSAALK